jgi:uncharacterized DUF497 family protein
MKPFRWNTEKNKLLKEERGITFKHIIISIENGGLVDVLKHPNTEKYPNQKILVVEHNGYVYLVPFVEEDEYYFLKTVIPSRKATRDYLSKGD